VLGSLTNVSLILFFLFLSPLTRIVGLRVKGVQGRFLEEKMF